MYSLIKEAIGIGENTQIALQNACKELGVDTDQVEFEIIEMEKKKTLGLFGGNPAKVRAILKISPAQVAADYLRDVIRAMGVEDAVVTVTESEDGAILALSGDNISLVIGRRGETLDALQYLTGLVANHVDDSYYRITIDTGNYREKREKTLEALAKRMAKKAIETNRKYALEPMNPYERRVIHTAVQEIENATSWSEGDSYNRHVVIGPAEGSSAKFGRDHSGRGGRGGDRDGRRRDRRSNRGRGGDGYRKNAPAEVAEVAETTEAPAVTAPAKVEEKREVSQKESSTRLYGKIEINK